MPSYLGRGIVVLRRQDEVLTHVWSIRLGGNSMCHLRVGAPVPKATVGF